MTNLFDLVNYSYTVVKIQAGDDPLHPSSRSSRSLFRTCFRVVLEVGLRLFQDFYQTLKTIQNETLATEGLSLMETIDSLGVSKD